MTSQSRRRAAALLEVLGVTLTGPLLIGQLIRLLRLPVTNPLTHLTVNITDRQLITASRDMFVLLVLQYAGYFLIIFSINWWYRRRGPAAYGLTRAGWSWRALLLAGLGTAAFAEWPVLGLSLANAIHPLGATAPWRQAFFDMSWRRWEFWLFAGVMSWALIPFIEELFFRGYCQRRLAEDWGDGPAIVGAACLFTFAHTQYQIANAYSIGMIVSLLVMALGLGVVFAWTRSLVPSMLAHAIINVPMTVRWQAVLLAAFVIGGVVIWRQGGAAVKKVFSNAGVATCAVFGLLGTGYAVAAERIEAIEYVAVGMLAVAIGFEAIERRKRAGGQAR